MAKHKTPHGVIAPLTTPFKSDGSICLTSLKTQVRFLCENGADALAVGGSAGEGHTLYPDEVRALVSTVKEEMTDGMPLVASAIVDSTHQAQKVTAAVADLEVDAIQMTPVHYLFKPDHEMMVEHFRIISDATDIPLIIYNVIPWSYLSPDETIDLMEKVPGIMGIKQSAGDLKLFADLMRRAPAGRQIYSAVDALMYPSFCLKTPGIIAATPAAIPHAVALLRDSVEKGNHEAALELHEVILDLWNAMEIYNLPACIRYAQELQGVDAGVPRMPMRPATEEQKVRIKPALEAVLKTVEKLS